MGLDDFMNVDGASKSSSSSSTSSSESILDKLDNFGKDSDGNVSRNGPYGYSSYDEYEETINGHITQNEALFKFKLPIYPHIDIDLDATPGTRYTRSVDQKTVICLSDELKQIKSVPRELIMLDTGECEKQLCMDALSDRVGMNIDPESELHVYMFAHTRHLVKMAIGDSMIDDWSLESKDHMLKAIYNESYTQRFRKSDSVNSDLKSTDHIDEW